MKRGALAAGLLLVVGVVSAASAQSSRDLVDLINGWRAGAHDCEGRRTTPLPPLAANPALAGGRLADTERPIEALKSRGYPAAAVHTVFVSGPTDPRLV